MDASGQLGLHSNTPGYVSLQNDEPPHPTAPPLPPGSSPQQPGYPPQHPGYPPQQPGYPPQQPGYPPQQPGYPPQQPGYPPQQPGYPPQQPGYPPQQPGYPPQQPDYPPQQPDYPPQQPGYPTQQPGYPPQQPGYPPQQPGYPPQQPVYPPQQPNYPPQQPGYPPQQPGYPPQPRYPSQPENSPQHRIGYPEPPGFVIPAGYPNPVDYNAPGNESKQPLMKNLPPVGFTPPPSGVLFIGFDPVNMPPAPVHGPPAAPPDVASSDDAPGNEGKLHLTDNPPPNEGFILPTDGAAVHGSPARGSAPPPGAVPLGGACASMDRAGLNLEAGKVKGLDFSENSIRLAFIRKVYASLMTQLLVTLSFVAFCLLHTPTNQFFERNVDFCHFTWCCSNLILICLVFCHKLCPRVLCDCIVLSIYTVATSLLLGCISSRFHSFEVLVVISLTAALCLSMTLIQFKLDVFFPKVAGMLLATLVILISSNIMVTIYPNAEHEMTFCLGAMLFSYFFICDTKKIIGGENDLAALSLYVEIEYIFMCYLAYTGSLK